MQSVVTVDNSKLPNGVTYDAGTKTISGTPNVTDWGSTEEKRKFEIPVVVTNPDGTKITKTVEITVLRIQMVTVTQISQIQIDDGDMYQMR